MSDFSREFDVLVVGGGPAGIAAAVRGAEGGASVGIVDENAAVGGQIWRGEASGEDSERTEWSRRLRASGIETLCGTRIFHLPERGLLLAENADGAGELRYRKLILATGARERFLPFPGWTLPNVMGAGGLQAMVKSGLPIGGRSVVVCGTGPLLLAVAAYLRKQGANVAMICEQASWARLAAFGAALAAFPRKVAQAWQLRKELAGIAFAADSWAVVAQGAQKVESVTISRSGIRETIRCDFLACGFHLVPNVELPILLGCRLRDGYVQVDDLQQTSVEGVFCAGEPTGIGGVESAIVEGQMAGLAAIGRREDARKLWPVRRKARRFARWMDWTFRLRPELRSLATSETIVCRCEDVTCAQLQPYGSWRAAKLQTRCGMGPCQGRVCGPATEFLFGWKTDSVRPPIFPVRVESLAGITEPQNVKGGFQ